MPEPPKLSNMLPIDEPSHTGYAEAVAQAWDRLRHRPFHPDYAKVLAEAEKVGLINRRSK